MLTVVLAGHALVLRHLPGPGAAVVDVPPTIAVRTITASTTAEAPMQPDPARTAPPRLAPNPARAATARRPASSPAPVPASPTDRVSHWPADQLDRRPVPVSAPPDPGDDDDVLATLPLSGRPLRLRLYIDARGRVEAVEPVVVDAFDADTLLPRLQAMFLRTAYVPGLRHGHEVASVSEIEVRVEHLGAALP